MIVNLLIFSLGFYIGNSYSEFKKDFKNKRGNKKYVGYSFNSWKNSIVFLQFVDNVKERVREFLKK